MKSNLEKDIKQLIKLNSENALTIDRSNFKRLEEILNILKTKLDKKNRSTIDSSSFEKLGDNINILKTNQNVVEYIVFSLFFN